MGNRSKKNRRARKRRDPRLYSLPELARPSSSASGEEEGARIMWGGSSERETIMDELARSIEGARRLRCFGAALGACWSLVLAVRFVAGCDVCMLVLPLCGIFLELWFEIDGRMSRAEALSRAALEMQLLGDMTHLQGAGGRMR